MCLYTWPCISVWAYCLASLLTRSHCQLLCWKESQCFLKRSLQLPQKSTGRSISCVFHTLSKTYWRTLWDMIFHTLRSRRWVWSEIKCCSLKFIGNVVTLLWKHVNLNPICRRLGLSVVFLSRRVSSRPTNGMKNPFPATQTGQRTYTMMPDKGLAS